MALPIGYGSDHVAEDSAALRTDFPGFCLDFRASVNSGHLRNRLQSTFSTRAARLGNLHELTKLAPVAILADTLGYSPATIERHAAASAATYAQYVSNIDDRNQ
ncbi:hypothetical protein M2405_001720 [Rhodococcus erythropolis]|uniref:hypothetical protein n=1 Tax=Rhodococcus erythropolis TaxID=1833 RepID=UPI00038E4F18|nr:hypothetical protein [Rhodococcus erythropolis]EQM32308.1 hypothetical protein N601_17080 [Rhodococcus erythropolis DN1]MCS4253442.1 hypothetical protein [Rhodococcus erythropolis]MCW2427520.1 hypothetical protein [Rhodococcus erythropolis]